jgi:hypothetical protein
MERPDLQALARDYALDPALTLRGRLPLGCFQMLPCWPATTILAG